ncbi:TPA: hypothetical protein QDB15_005355 [Burkholderia vietnamiensis]|uniref:hypothetical protein n=1 Tax=Burkholderia vietnamiensis TaxID=60552 RepID=UPI001594D0DF|nr:hypothetical protein [Burkholderia vietnamiensis]MCA8206560.1 hypothetical protein [Burkholderia vietnamiensis]MDN8067358.1 hypothetical protein [Burkholderia vietnamiensis]HDR9098760.1 hypothetical protein [Burkholderia vietnamiensis]HDR9121507.1 hypothetical protein [Burkholderia vietnamiensis]HDR9163297.1 hypothetical protein [Burkholderia vietnamiensis]
MNPKYAHLYDGEILNDIAVGLVLHLDPDVLEQKGGTYTCEPALRVQGQHFFVCISVDGNTSRWLPLYSNEGDGRTLVEPNAKKGHAKWQQSICYWHKDQIWEASGDAVYWAAGRAHDKSRKGTRNTLDVASVPNI